MRFGSALHTYTLEPDLFAARYACKPEGIDRRTKEGKAAWELFLQEAGTREHTTTEELAQLDAMRLALRRHPAAAALIDGRGESETSVFWTDPETGVRCRCRPDRIRHDGIVVDLKSTEDASPGAVARTMHNLGYYIQAPFYADGCLAAGVPVRAFAFVFVEKQAPHAVACYVLDEQSMEAGRRAYRDALATVAKCQATNTWPSYSDQLNQIALPAWALRAANENQEANP
jgi:exodeoxyribonuclease VIII